MQDPIAIDEYSIRRPLQSYTYTLPVLISNLAFSDGQFDFLLIIWGHLFKPIQEVPVVLAFIGQGSSEILSNVLQGFARDAAPS
jgi:hypothetical protein